MKAKSNLLLKGDVERILAGIYKAGNQQHAPEVWRAGFRTAIEAAAQALGVDLSMNNFDRELWATALEDIDDTER